MGPCPTSRIEAIEADIQTIKDSAGCPCNCVSIDQHLALYNHCIALVQRIVETIQNKDTQSNKCTTFNALLESIREDVAKLEVTK